MQKLQSDRVGIVLKQLGGYDAFIPRKIHPDGLGIKIDPETIRLLSEADRALGELKGMTETLPDPDLFIAFYVPKEALLSSQIEGIECSLDEVLQFSEKGAEIKPVQEVVNYIKAMNEGLSQLENLPMSLRLMNSIHEILLTGVRGEDKSPGEFKNRQNWVGPPGCQLAEATYIPPPPNVMTELMGDWEKYYHVDKNIPPLVEAAMLHSHFETIHPYIDGNGRFGRLLITFMLCERRVLDKPLLYLSLFFKENKREYYQLLMNVRFRGEVEEWVKFFLRGVRNTSREAINTAKEIRHLQDKHSNLVKEKFARYRMSIPLYDFICKTPIISIANAARELHSSYPTIQQVIGNFVDVGILEIYRARKRNKLYAYSDYLNILRRGTD